MLQIESSSFVLPPDLAPCNLQVAGFHRAVPSTTLDKACMQLLDDYTNFFDFVNTIRRNPPPKFTIRIWTFLVKADKIVTISSRSELFEKLTQTLRAFLLPKPG